MAEQTPTPEPTKPRPKKIRRLVIGTNVVIQTIIVVGLALMANYLSYRHNRQFDFTRDQTYTLSGQTKRMLENLKKPVKAIVVFEALGMLRSDIIALLQEYEKASKKKFKVEFLSVYNDPAKGKELVAKYKIGPQDRAVIILDCDGRSKLVSSSDLAEFGAFFSEKTNQEETMIKSFKGETVITAKMIELLDDQPSEVYYVVGHGETPSLNPSLSRFQTLFKRQNGAMKEISLSDVDKIPPDARAVMINGPKADLSEREIRVLNEYWDRKGRVFIGLNPEVKLVNLNAWLVKQGVLPQDDRVLRTEEVPKITDDQRIIMTTEIQISPRAKYAPGNDAMLRELRGLNTVLVGPTQSLKYDKGIATVAQTSFYTLIEAAKNFWGETNYADLGDGKYLPVAEPKTDHMDELVLGMAVEKGGVEDARVKVEASRMVVFGNAAMLDAESIKSAGENNVYCVLNTLNWLMNREIGSGIPPQTRSEKILSLESWQIRNLSLLSIIIIPATIGIFGMLVWWQRRY